jgi:RNA polymerase sigma-70 factor (ECF subfamily)
MDRKRHAQFAELFVRNQNRVYRYIVSLIPDRAQAEDLFQQTSLTLWETWERYDAQLDFVRWACGIAHNHVRNHFRKRQGPLALSDDVLDRLGRRRLEQDDVLEDRRRLLASCLAELDGRHRGLIDRAYGGGGTMEDLARQEGQTPNALYKLLRRLRSALHDCVSRKLALERQT